MKERIGLHYECVLLAVMSVVVILQSDFMLGNTLRITNIQS